MGREVKSPTTAEKERIRAEIEDQVQQFLKKGGSIDVVNQGGANQQRQLGSIWQNLDDEIGLSSQASRPLSV